MFNNSSHVDANHSTFSEVHLDQHYNARPTVQGNQMINTVQCHPQDAPLLVVIDALDECDDESLVSELIALLASLPRKTSLPLRLLITSRSEPWLQPDICSFLRYADGLAGRLVNLLVYPHRYVTVSTIIQLDMYLVERCLDHA